jgi:hypothetical protein
LNITSTRKHVPGLGSLLHNVLTEIQAAVIVEVGDDVQGLPASGLRTECETMAVGLKHFLDRNLNALLAKISIYATTNSRTDGD